MKRYSDLEFLRLNKFKRFFYKIAIFFVGIPVWFKNTFLNIGRFFKKVFLTIGNEFKDLVMTFVNGDWKTRVSYLIMGFGNATRGQIARGILFFGFEVIFVVYMILAGGKWLSMMPLVGQKEPGTAWVIVDGFEVETTVIYNDSFKTMLYSVLTIFFIIAFFYTWRLNIKQNKMIEEIIDNKSRRALRKECDQEIAALKEADDIGLSEKEIKVQEKELKKSLHSNAITKEQYEERLEQLRLQNKIYATRVKYQEQIDACGKKLKSGKDDVKSLIDDEFHKTLLALPVTGILIFTVMPIIFMILVAFTNYSGNFNGQNHPFVWKGFENFGTIFNWTSGSKAYSATFLEILAWTLIWAFFATFSNYFLGMLVAIMINKKGIKFKKVWRTVLVLTIAIPQFISLLYVSKMFAYNGLVNGFLTRLGVDRYDFFGNATSARITVILINIWIGIPYLMLIATGILMNIPEDLYESANIDGANVWQQYMKITLPYMLFITGPYLLTSFTGNMNNFNVIYLLTGGGPTNAKASSVDGTVGHTDLLITWLFKITQGEEAKFYMASVVGILVFVVVGFISVVVYNILPSNRNEEDFQ